MLRRELLLKILLPSVAVLACFVCINALPSLDARYVVLYTILFSVASFLLVELFTVWSLGGREIYNRTHHISFRLREAREFLASPTAARSPLSDGAGEGLGAEESLREAIQRAEESLASRRLEDLRASAIEIEALYSSMKLRRKSVLREYSEAIFGSVFVALSLRAFLLEPFQIPSGSMVPTLRVSDFILVSKSHYSLRLPIIDVTLLQYRTPKRGDVIVFEHPNPNPSDVGKDLIKRVVAVEGDKISMFNNVLTINKEKIPLSDRVEFSYLDETEGRLPSIEKSFLSQENLFGYKHPVLYQTSYTDDDPQQPCTSLHRASAGIKCWENRGPDCRWLKAPGYKGLDPCVAFDDPAIPFVVPPGYVFVMGDNRDNSDDSRGWGPVPIENIKGKALFVWFAGRLLTNPKINWDRFFTKIE